MKKRVLLWMSGGIDSTVCAYLLKEQWYEVVWVFMRYWVDSTQNTWIEKEDKISENKCCSLEAQMSAMKTCKNLWIDFHIHDVKTKFYEDVVKYFLNIHKTWMTPNPCVQCNLKIKWWDILGKLKHYKCDYIATWHYAKIQDLNWKKYVYEWTDKKKDQSYFMSVLSHQDLEKIIFPLWETTKEHVKELAKKYWEEEVFKKKESQWVCFFNEDSYIPFLKRNLPELFKEWKYMFLNETIKETHQWLPYYTIGQRKWLPWWFDKPIYVTWFDYEKNQVLLWYDEDLWKKELIVQNPNFMDGLFKEDNIKIRIRHLGFLIEVKKIEAIDQKKWNSNKFKVSLKKPIRAVTPGQFAVFYSNEWKVLWNWLIIQ